MFQVAILSGNEEVSIVVKESWERKEDKATCLASEWAADIREHGCDVESLRVVVQRWERAEAPPEVIRFTE